MIHLRWKTITITLQLSLQRRSRTASLTRRRLTVATGNPSCKTMLDFNHADRTNFKMTTRKNAQRNDWLVVCSRSAAQGYFPPQVQLKVIFIFFEKRTFRKSWGEVKKSYDVPCALDVRINLSVSREL